MTTDLIDGFDLEPKRVGVFTLLNPRDHGGLETYIRALTDSLMERGHEVIWNGRQPTETAGDRELLWRRRRNALVRLMTRKPTRWLARRIAELQGARWCRKAVEMCDVVHFVGNGWELLGFPLERAAREQHKCITCLPAVHPGVWGDSPLDIDFYNSMDAVFALSDYEASYLTSKGANRSRFVRCVCAAPQSVHGNADRIRLRHSLQGKEVVLFAGRKSRNKGYHALRKAIATLNQQGRPIVLVSIGRDVEPPYPALSENVDLDLGAADENTKHDAFAACDVFALPSAEESFGIVYLEAWSYGKAVVCGSAPASRELIAKHDAGYFTDGSQDDIADKLRLILNDHEIRHRLGENGRRAVASTYTAQSVLEAHTNAWVSHRQANRVSHL